MGASVGAAWKRPWFRTAGTTGGRLHLEVRLLGTLSVARDGAAVALPPSRKVRALFGYLALAPQPAGRSQLCELLWDVPNDPRGELRWCLSKIRSLVDEPGRRRVDTRGDTVALDLADCFVDAIEVAAATREGIETLANGCDICPRCSRRLSRRIGDRPQSAVQQLADRAAPPLSRLPRCPTGASGRSCGPARRCSFIWRSGFSWRRSTAACTRRC